MDFDYDLVEAAQEGNIKKVKELMKGGADIHQVNPRDGKHIINYVIPTGDTKMIEFLVKQKVDLTHTVDKQTPLMLAIKSKFDDVSLILIKATPKKLIDVGANSFTPLAYACSINRYKLIKPLLKAGADINHQNTAGDTPIIAAVRYNAIDSALILIEEEADLTIKNKDGTLVSNWFPMYPELEKMIVKTKKMKKMKRIGVFADLLD